MPKRNATAKPKNFKVSLMRLLTSLKPWRAPIIISVLMTVGSTVATIFGPKILGTMTTDAVTSFATKGEIDWAPIASSAQLLLGLYVLSSVLNYIQSLVLAQVTARYTQKLRLQIIDKIAKLPISYFDRHQFGDTLSRMTNDVDTIAESLSQSLSQIITSVTMVVGILIMMLTISVWLSLIALVAIPISIVFVQKVAKKAQGYFRKQQRTLGKIGNTIEEDYAGQLVIKANSREELSTAAFMQENEALYQTAWRAQFFSSMAFPIAHIFTNLSYVAICVVGGYMAADGKISIGDIQAFIQYVNQFNRPITEVAQTSATIQLTLAASERITNFLAEREEEPDAENAEEIAQVEGAVEFEHVSFTYADNDHPTIKDFSVKVPPGSQVAIVGPTGAGKTTLVNLLMRFYEPSAGKITIDGVPTGEMRRADVRSMFGMVLQDTWLFFGTIEENLRYGRKGATHQEVVKATKASSVHHFIESLAKGYDTVISEDSDNVSAGEKQLLTIARAMVANPPMIILDEATSNVDTRTEQLIQAAFEKLTKGRTSFVIAHRLSTIREADLILVMNEGEVVEQGNHADLMAKNGFYAELYNSQFAE